MITVLLINLIGVAIYVAGVGLCLRAIKRTGNIGYLLLAGYFAAALLVSSVQKVAIMQRGPVASEYVAAADVAPELEKAAAPEEAVPAEAVVSGAKTDAAELAGEPPLAEQEEEPQIISDSPWESVSLPILPALLLAGAFFISRDDPRRRREEEEEVKEDNKQEVEGDGRNGDANA